jgi:hypothetical protein
MEDDGKDRHKKNGLAHSQNDTVVSLVRGVGFEPTKAYATG